MEVNSWIRFWTNFSLCYFAVWPIKQIEEFGTENFDQFVRYWSFDLYETMKMCKTMPNGIFMVFWNENLFLFLDLIAETNPLHKRCPLSDYIAVQR